MLRCVDVAMSDGGGGVGYGRFLFTSLLFPYLLCFLFFMEKFKEKLSDNIVYTYIVFIQNLTFTNC